MKSLEAIREARARVEKAGFCDLPTDGCIEMAAYHAFKLGKKSGRIAGLREAAKIVCHFDGWVPGGSLPTIRSLANALAKKARAK